MWNVSAMLVAAASGGLMIPAMHNWTADLKPTPGHQVSGTATFNGDTKDVVKVSLTLENAQPNTTLTWHVHKGACAVTDGPIVGKQSAYAPVQVDGSGRVNTTVDLPMDLNGSTYSVRVHESADLTKSAQAKNPEAGPAACGELRAQGNEKANRQ